MGFVDRFAPVFCLDDSFVLHKALLKFPIDIDLVSCSFTLECDIAFDSYVGNFFLVEDRLKNCLGQAFVRLPRLVLHLASYQKPQAAGKFRSPALLPPLRDLVPSFSDLPRTHVLGYYLSLLRGWSFSLLLFTLTHGLRHGLYSAAASRLGFGGGFTKVQL